MQGKVTSAEQCAGHCTEVHTPNLGISPSLDTTQHNAVMNEEYLCEPEDVVNKEQHILALDITEVLCYGQSSQRHTSAGTWGLVHLPEHQSALALSSLLADLVDTLPDTSHGDQKRRGQEEPQSRWKGREAESNQN